MNVSPVLALAGLAVVGLLATRLPRPRWRHVKGLDLMLAGGGPLLLLGLALGPGIDLLARPTLQTVAPVTALAVGWLGAGLGAQFEWRYVRRIPRAAWLPALLAASAALVVAALAAWLAAQLVPALGAAWMPRLPAILALGAIAAASGPGAVALAARAAGIGRSAAHAVALAATLETACAAVALTIPLALHRAHQPAGSAALGWLAWIVLATGSGVLVCTVFLSLTRLRPARADLGLALLATMLFGAGIGYAAELSPFVVCALGAALIVNLAPLRHVVRQVLADWEPTLGALLLVIAGALLTLPTAWILLAAPLLAALRIAARWAGPRAGRLALKLPDLPFDVGLATVAQGGAAIALGVNFFLMYGGRGAGSSGAVLMTVVLGVTLAQLAAPRLMALALRPAPAPLTQPAALPELSPGRSSEVTT